jgi:carbonic anhydrase
MNLDGKRSSSSAAVLDGSYLAPAEGALEALRMGNVRFTTGQMRHPNQDLARRSAVISGQSPFAAVLTCSDSRLPPELIFDQGVGDIFVVRTAGNVLDDIALGSVEYAVEHLQVPLVLILGHQKCGAVSAAVQATVEGGELPGYLADIAHALEPAVAQARTLQGDLLSNAIDANVLLTVERLRQCEPILAEAVRTGQVKIAGARYQLDSGKVQLLPE